MTASMSKLPWTTRAHLLPPGQRWPSLSDYERDERASDLQIAAFDRVAQKRQVLTKFEEDLREAVAEINGNVIKLTQKN